MPSPPRRQAPGKNFKFSEASLRPMNLNSLHSSRRFSQQSPVARFGGRDYFYGNQRRARQQDYYNDYVPNRRYNGYGEWSRQSQRFPRQLQNYNDNRFYQSKRMLNLSILYLIVLFLLY